MNTKNAKKSQPKEEKEVRNINVTSFDVKNVRVIDGKNGDVIFFTLVLNEIEIYNCRAVNGKNGDFISFPQVPGKDNKYYNTVYARLDREVEKQILDCVQDHIDRM